MCRPGAVPYFSVDCLEGSDKCAGAVSYLASMMLCALGGYGFYQSYKAWDRDHDFALFLAVQGLFLVFGAVLCFISEMRIPSIRASILQGFSFTWSRQGRGWFFIFLGLYSMWLPFDPSNPWITKTCGSFQLAAGAFLCSLAYIGGLKEDLYGGTAGGMYSSSSSSSSSTPSARERLENQQLEDWGGGGLSKRHAPSMSEGESNQPNHTGVTPILRPGLTTNPFLEAQKAAESNA
jgi:hypothetical protein